MGNRYEILRKLGQGGMGTVYLARLKGDAGFERLVALKKLSPEAVASSDLRALFEREIQIGARLAHPSIVQVYDAGISGGEPYLATEYVDGGDLEDVIGALRTSGTRLPPEVLAHVGSQVCQALAFMSQVTDEQGKKLIQAHRDVSPGNILVSRAGAVKLADFGVARLTTSSTSTTVVRGKWQYFAPEISSQDPDIRSDIFALGIVLYQLASLVHPFEASTAQGFYERASTVNPPKPSGMPDALWTVLQRALAKLPSARFQTPDELSETLERFVISLGNPVTPAVLARTLAPLLPPPVPATVDPKLEQPFKPATEAGTSSGFEMDPEWHAVGPSLGADGRVVDGPVATDARAAVPVQRTPAKPAQFGSGMAIEGLVDSHLSRANNTAVPTLAQSSTLELQDRPLPPLTTGSSVAPNYAPDVSRPRSKLVPVLAVIALVGAGLGVWAWQVLPRPAGLIPGSGSPTLVLIESDPTGAAVFSGKEQLGITPLSFANDYASDAPVQLTLKHRGFRPADLSFIGGRPQHLEVKLEKQR